MLNFIFALGGYSVEESGFPVRYVSLVIIESLTRLDS